MSRIELIKAGIASLTPNDGWITLSLPGAGAVTVTMFTNGDRPVEATFQAAVPIEAIVGYAALLVAGTYTR